MSIQHLEAAAETDLPASKKLVFMALCDDANKITRRTYPGREKLILWSGVKARRVQDILDELVAEGYIARLTYAQPGRKAEFLVFPNAAEIAASAGADTTSKAPAGPVDNSENAGALECTHTSNGCTFGPNGCTPECTPPVSNSRDLTLRSSTEPHLEAPVENDSTDGISPTNNRPLRPTPRRFADRHAIDLPKFKNAVGWAFIDCELSDELLHHLALEIVSKSRSAVIDFTAYAIKAVLNDAPEWQRRGFELAAESRPGDALDNGADF